ncbi:hypothetical protein HUJ05_012722 [Dendroctonus ponderosae]|nr:hypothetical protein HUJ05_012722 [Dendroctonus ponderosae]
MATLVLSWTIFFGIDLVYAIKSLPIQAVRNTSFKEEKLYYEDSKPTKQQLWKITLYCAKYINVLFEKSTFSDWIVEVKLPVSYPMTSQKT